MIKLQTMNLIMSYLLLIVISGIPNNIYHKLNKSTHNKAYKNYDN